jgi:hypothetical protein
MTKAAELAKMGEVLTNSQIGGRRNIFYNPKMAVAQRATSVTGKTSGGYFTCDRWNVNLNTLGTWSISQATDVPSSEGFSNSMKFDCTTADASPASGDAFWVEQRFEGQDLQQLKKGTSSAEVTTLSFWVKSNKTGTYIVNILDNNASTRQISKAYTIDSANTWEQKVISIDADTSNVLPNDNSFEFVVSWWLGAGSSFTSGSLQTTWGAYDATKRAVGQVNLADSTDNEWYITGVQWELGTATPFEHRSFGEELQLCKRYCNALLGGTDGNRLYTYNYNASYKAYLFYFPVAMRAAPAVTLSTSGGSGTAAIFTKESMFRYISGGSTVGTAYYIYDFTFDSEL